MILAREFSKQHNMSNCWATLSKQQYPDGYYFKNKRLYIIPDKVWFRSDEMNRTYNHEFFNKIEGLYYELSEHFIDYRIGTLLSINSNISRENWVVYVGKFRFRRGAKADEFMARCELILTLIGEYGDDYEGIKAELLTIK